jgi:hypothetical protein
MWSDNEALDVDKLNAMTNNDQWLFENMPRARFSVNPVKNTGVKILGVRGYVAPSSASSGATNVYFGNMFSQGCRPLVVASAVHTNWQRRSHVAVNGLGNLAEPDYTGCKVTVSIDEWNSKYLKVASGIYVHILAMGW